MMTDPDDLDLEDFSLAELAEVAADCTACELYRNATQTVFGEGPPKAPLMLLGEQPGDREDIEGEPFVGDSLAALMAPLGVRRFIRLSGMQT